MFDLEQIVCGAVSLPLVNISLPVVAPMAAGFFIPYLFLATTAINCTALTQPDFE